MIAKIEARIKELESTINQSLANHNALLGMLSEAKSTLGALSADASEAVKVASAVLPAGSEALTVAEDIADVVEAVAAV